MARISDGFSPSDRPVSAAVGNRNVTLIGSFILVSV